MMITSSRAQAVVLALLFALPGALGVAASQREAPAEKEVPLLLSVGSFDPLRAPPPLPDDLRAPDTDGYRILQFTGPVLDSWKQEVERCGVQLFRYLPEFAFITRMTPLQEMILSGLPFVRWVGPFHPGYKLSPDLERERGTIEMSVLFLERPDELELRIRQMGVDVVWRDWLSIRVKAEVGVARCIAFIPFVEYVEPFHGATLLNSNAARIIAIRQTGDGAFLSDGSSLWSYNSAAFEGTTGRNVTVAVADTGVDGNHVDLSIKKVWYKSYLGGADWTDSQGHGTHVAGSVLGTGAGQNGRYAGMAPGAMLIGLQAIAGGISNEAANAQTLKDAQDHGADICTNSWGDPTNHGTYGAMAIAYDTAVRDCDPSEPGNQSMIVLFGAGNEAFTGIREPATAKNVITVGATGNNVGLDPDQIASFSSNGPTGDGRRKPDIMAPGLQVTSCAAGTGNGYRAADGTSMSTPIAAGAAAVVVQYCRENHGFTPSPAMMKALLANGAVPMSASYPYPGMGQGWGRINLANTLLSRNAYQLFMEDQNVTLRTSEEQLYNVNVISSATPLKIMLSWTDPPGAAPAEKKLVNDLDLVVLSPAGSTYYGNNFTNGQSAPGGNPDDRNNLEGFYLKSPAPGTWVVKVRGVNIPSGPQDYAIVVSGDIQVSPDFVDLMVESGPTTLQRELVEGEEVTFSATIRNNGTLPALGAQYRVLVNNILIENVTLPELRENTSIDISPGWVASRGRYLVRVELDPLNLIRERNETNNAAGANIEVLYHGLLVIASAERREVDPGAPAVYYLDVKNAGTANDTYSLERVSPEPPPGWTEELNATNLTIGRSSSMPVNLTVRPPANATVGENHTTRIVVTSGSNQSYTQTLNFTTVVRQVFGMEFNLTSPQERLVDSGENLSLNFTLRNPGNGRDFYRIGYRVVGMGPGWPVRLSAEELVLWAREQVNVTLWIDIPADARANESAVVEVTASSSQGERASYKTRAVVRQAYGTTISIFGVMDRIEPGRTLLYTVTLANTGNGNDTLFLRASGPPGWTVALERSAILLAPWSEGTVELSVTCPAGHLAGAYNVSVTSTGSGGNVASLTHNITVNQNYRISLDASPESASLYAGERADLTLLVGNLGNGNDTIELSGVDILSDWGLEFSMPNVTLGPGEFTEVPFSVLTSNLTPEGNYTVRVRAVSLGRSVIQNTTTVRVEILMAPEPPPPPPPPQPPPQSVLEPPEGVPSWLLPLIGIVCGCIAAGAVSLALLRRRRRRTAAEARIEEIPPEASPIEAPAFLGESPMDRHSEETDATWELRERRSSAAALYARDYAARRETYDASGAEPTGVSSTGPAQDYAPDSDAQPPPGPLYTRLEEDAARPTTQAEAPGPRYLSPDWQPDQEQVQPQAIPPPEEGSPQLPPPPPEERRAPSSTPELDELVKEFEALKRM
ncbi:MAG: S8 family serine peptidase [Thermoplasmatota archaeon]